MAAPAFLSRHLSSNRKEGRTRFARVFSSPPASAVLSALAAGEIVADKVPGIPARTELPALGGRAFAGAISGAVIAGERGGSQIGAACVGASAAVCATYLAHAVRSKTGEALGVPDTILALVEDSLVWSAGSRIVRALE